MIKFSHAYFTTPPILYSCVYRDSLSTFGFLAYIGHHKKCRDLVGFELQNRTVARKFSIEGLYVCLGGIGILKFDKTLPIYNAS